MKATIISPLTEEQTAKLTAELNRVRGHFPFRIVWGACHPSTGEVLVYGSLRRATMSMKALIAKGYVVCEVAKV